MITSSYVFSQYNFESITLPEMIPLLAGVLTLSLGVAVLLQYRTRLGFTMFLFTLSISVWLMGTFMMFASTTDAQSMFWDRFIYIGVVFIPTFIYHFALAFTEQSRPKMLFWSYIASTFFLFISRTNYFTEGLFRYEWGVHMEARLFHHVFLLFFFVVYLAALKILYDKYQEYKKAKNYEILKQYRLVFWANILFFTIGSFGYLPAYKIGVYPFAMSSGIIYVMLLSYAMMKYEVFKLKIVASEIFSFGMALFFLVRVFLSGSVEEALVNGAILLLVTFFGVLFIRSISSEIGLRTKLQTTNAQLEDLNENLEAKVAEQTKEIRRAYEVEKKARHELEELDKAKTDFILTTQHHLRTPLTVVKGVADMLIRKQKGDTISDTDQAFIKKLHDGSSKLGNLINEFLDISQMEVGKSILQKTNVKVNDLVDESIKELSHEIEQKQLRIETTFSDEAKEVMFPVDKKRIQSAFTNLLDNAVKYTPLGGVLI
jgi:signal transduction histidine kinase